MHGKDLSDWIDRRGYTTTTLGEALGVTGRCVRRWCSGDRGIPADLEGQLELLPQTPHRPKLKEKRCPVREDGNVAYLTLPCGREAIVDVADLPLVMNRPWHSRRAPHTFYVTSAASDAEVSAGSPLGIKMHNVILQNPGGLLADHRNGNGLDNRRSNLRLATILQNAQNRKPTAGRELPKGVMKKRGKFLAKIRVDGMVLELGYFLTIEEAAAAYDKAAHEHHGEFARPNTPTKAVDVSALDIPVGLEKPAYGSLAKKPKGGKRAAG
jgi:HNH endonuclease